MKNFRYLLTFFTLVFVLFAAFSEDKPTVGQVLDREFDEVQLNSFYFDTGDLEYRRNGVARRERLVDRKLRNASDEQKLETPLQESLEGMSLANIILPSDENKNSTLSKNITRDLFVEFLRTPLSQQRGVDFIDPADDDKDDTPVFFLLGYVNRNSEDPNGYQNDQRKLKKFILFARQKLFGSAFDEEITDDEYAKVIGNLNKLRDVVTALTVSEQEKGAPIGKKYQEHLENLVASIVIGKGSDHKLDRLEKAIVPFAEDALTDAVYRLIPQYVSGVMGDTSTINRDLIEEKIKNLINNFEFEYFDNALFQDRNLKGSLKTCLKSALIMDAMVKCVKQFAEASHGELLEIVMESIQVGNKLDQKVFNFEVDRDIRQRALENLRSFDSLELTDDNHGMAQRYMARVRDIVSRRRMELGKLNFDLSHVREASVNFPDEIAQSDPEYLKLKLLYAVEKSAHEWFEDFIDHFAEGLGVDPEKTPELQELKLKVQGENGLIRKLADELLAETDLGNKRNIFATYLDVIENGVPLTLKKLKNLLDDEKIEETLKKVAKKAVNDKMEEALGTKVVDTEFFPYRQQVINQLKKITDTAITSAFSQVRGSSQDKFNKIILDFDPKQTFVKRMAYDALTKNEENIKELVNLFIDQIIVRNKIKPYAEVDDQGKFTGFSEKYLELKSHLVDNVVQELLKQVGSSLQKYSVKDLISRYEEIIIETVRNSLNENERDGTTFRDEMGNDIKQAAYMAIDHYAEEMNKVLDYHLVSREPLYRKSFLSYFSMESPSPSYFSTFQHDTRHFGTDFLIAKASLKFTANSVIDSVLDEVQNNGELKSVKDIQEAINKRLRVELSKFHDKNGEQLDNMSQIFASRAVYDLIPGATLEKGTKGYESYRALNEHLTIELGPKILDTVKSLPDNFDFFDKNQILDHLRGSIKEVVLDKDGTLDKLQKFINDISLDKIHEVLKRYKDDSKIKSLIPLLEKANEQKIQDAFDTIRSELEGKPLTMEGLGEIVDNIDAKILHLVESSFSTRIDPQDPASKLLFEEIGAGIIDFEFNKVTSGLAIKPWDDDWKEVNDLRNHLKKTMLPELLGNLIKTPLAKGYSPDDDLGTKIGAINERYTNYFISIRQEVINSFNDPRNKKYLNLAVDSYVETGLNQRLAGVLLPEPLSEYPEDSKVSQSFQALEDRLKAEAQVGIQEIMTYEQQLSRDASALDRIGLHVDTAVNNAFKRLFENENEQESLLPLLTNVADSLFEEHLLNFLHRMGYSGSDQAAAFIKFKNTFIYQFRNEFMPVLKDHLKDVLDASLFDQLRHGKGHELGKELLDKAFYAFNKSFLQNPNIKEYIYEMTDTLVDDLLSSQNPILGKKYEAEITSPIEKYRPQLKKELKLFIDSLLEDNEEKPLVSIEDLLNRVQETVAEHVYTKHRAHFISQTALRQIYNENGYIATSKHTPYQFILDFDKIIEEEQDPVKREQAIRELTKTEPLTLETNFNNQKQQLSLEMPSPYWEYVSVSELLSSPYLLMQKGEGIDPFLDRLGGEDISKALRPFGDRLMAFIKYQTFCEAAGDKVTEQSYPCHTEENPILSDEMALTIKFLRISSEAEFSESGGECFQATWDLLSSEKFSKHIENEDIEILKKPLKSIGIFLEKEGVAYKENPPSFMDCAVMGYGVEFGNRVPIEGLEDLAQYDPGVRDNVSRLQQAVNVFTTPEKFRAYLKDPQTQQAKNRIQQTLITGLKNFTIGNSDSAHDDPNDALVARVAIATTHEYLPSVAQTSDYRRGSLEAMLSISREDPAAVLRSTISMLAQDKSWIVRNTGTADVLSWGVDNWYGIESVVNNIGYTSKANGSHVKMFEQSYPQCFESFNNDFNAPILLSLQFLAAASIKKDEHYSDRENVEITSDRTLNEVSNYFKKESCVQHTPGMETSIVRAATAITEIVSAIKPMVKHERRPANIADFWQDAAVEFTSAGMWIKDHKQKLDMMLWLFTPPIEKENMCHPRKGARARLAERFRSGPLKDLKDKKAELEAENDKIFYKRWYNWRRIGKLEEEFEQMEKDLVKSQEQVKYLKECVAQDCKRQGRR